MVSTSGDVLAGPSILSLFREELFPMADIVNPNLKKASLLPGGVRLETVNDMRSAAKSIHDMGPQNVLVKGGDLPAPLDVVDIFYDGKDFYELWSSRVETCNTHKVAKNFVENALEYSKDIVIGKGPQGPFDHLTKLKKISYCQGPFNLNDLFLYAVTNSGMNKKWSHSITDAVKAAIEGGATIIQLSY